MVLYCIKFYALKVASTVLHHYTFKGKVNTASFSPDGKYFAVGVGKHTELWKAPGLHKEFAPFVHHRTYTGHHDDVTCIGWSSDSKFFSSGSEDMTARVYSVHPIAGFTPRLLSGHRDYVSGVFFSSDDSHIYTVCRNGALFCYRKVVQGVDEHGIPGYVAYEPPADGTGTKEAGDENMAPIWHLYTKHYFNHNHAKVICAGFHEKTNVLAVGFSNGVFCLYELPSFTEIHSLSISRNKISSVAINATGEWIAFGSEKLGQLLVWEWQSESYVLKQQGHFHEMGAVAYSPDGQLICTGGDDGKVKVWNTRSGFCFVTFSEHTASVTGVRFSHSGHAVYSCSLDGTVRAYDLIRYRNFRTMTSPQPVQFSCLAVDPASEMVCAGTQDTFDIYVWSLQTGRLLEVLSGHEGPITALHFNPLTSVLCSGSWDHELRMWDIFDNKASTEALPHTTDIRAFCFAPSGKEICVSTLDGQLTFWNVEEAKQVGSIECRRDIAGGRKRDDLVTAKNSASGKCFTSVCYSADGQVILAGGRTKYVCIYSVAERCLLKRFQITINSRFDGLLEKLNSKYITEAGTSMENYSDGEGSDLEDRVDHSLPGVAKGDLSKRNTRPEIRTRGVEFSPTGSAWAAATVEGLLIYSLDQKVVFDPYDLDIDVTPDTVKESLQEKEYEKAFSLALRLNEKELIIEVIESIPHQQIVLVVPRMGGRYIERALDVVAWGLENRRRIEFYLLWSFHILNVHGRYLKERSDRLQPVFRALQKSASAHKDSLAKLCQNNTYTMAYIQTLTDFANAENADTELGGDDDTEMFSDEVDMNEPRESLAMQMGLDMGDGAMDTTTATDVMPGWG
ncbi:hypothetical protein SARC_05255 [Sphaeroforma arctica JP610]|uniref:Small-subunit processome Utp12 domain-containing protein n=1 Tax=Sphaeroforma arctica JP610 TaxID=667725 RepID=A0A0L0G2N6_9EUKA|nr:hypothetical protein SARC_05255 [Sphaeroforma arctica JP610]KNC82463.1 hypothetical protein SARC_05255 [Sphaeroforma arctica JP610]|eukprot:XP_014156365.1 hypothetical protein SARC_05255 [Sphaeroforma arctica JP610]